MNPFNFTLFCMGLFFIFGVFILTVYKDLPYTNYSDNHLCIEDCWEQQQRR